MDTFGSMSISGKACSSLNLSNDANDAISILPDGQLRLEFANPDGEEGPDDPP